MQKKVAILQSNYIPWKGYFDIINAVDEFVIYDDVSYTKNDWRNRNRIKTREGLLWLSIPVKTSGYFNQKILNAEVAKSEWHKKHWETLRHSYGKTSGFKVYSETIHSIYEKASAFTLLTDINELFLKQLCEILQIKTRIRKSEEFEFSGNRNQKLISILKQLNADVYLSGPSALSYLDLNLFKAENIRVEFINYENYPEYSQLYPPFIHQVSVMDLIFNTGSSAYRYLKTNQPDIVD